MGEPTIEKTLTWKNAPWIDPETIQEGVYILHFNKRVKYKNAANYGNQRHYVGCSKNIFRRVGQHQNGVGSVMTQLAVSDGVEITVAAVFPGDTYSIEYMITKIGATNFCPICLNEKWNKEKAKSEAKQRKYVAWKEPSNQARIKKEMMKKRYPTSPFRK